MLRSVDMQQILLQSNAIERVQEAQQQEPNIQQKYFENQLNKEQSLLKEKVKDLAKADQLIIKEENKESKKHKHSKKTNRKIKKEETSNINTNISTHEITRKLDIKV